MTTIIIILVLIAIAVVIYVIASYNGLVNKRNKVANSWSQIDVQLKEGSISYQTWSKR